MATNPDGSVTEVTSEGWFSRVGGSFKGIGAGIVLVLVATGVLWWNEGRAVRTGDAIAEAQQVTIAMPSIERIDPAFDGKLVHASGLATTTQTVSDTLFGVAPPPILALERRVEYYQWVENSSRETKKKLGGGTETTTTYNYEAKWVKEPIDSTKFKNPKGHDNTLRTAGVQLKNETFRPTQVSFGAYQLPDFLAGGINKSQTFTPAFTAEQLAALRTRLLPRDTSLGASVARAAIEKSASGAAEYLGDSGRVALSALMGESVKLQPLADGSLYIGQAADTPQPGDVRVRWLATPAADVTIIAKAAGNTFTKYTASNGNTFSSLAMGRKDMGEMFESARSGNTFFTWVLRALGVGIAIGAFGLILAPLGVLASVVPLLGAIVEAGTGLVATLLGVAWSFIIIALAWLRFRPLLSIALLVVAAGLIAAIFMLRRKRAAAAA